MLKSLLLILLSNLCLLVPAWADTEVLVIRHGEKPAQGLGQLNCRGLNRALALPRLIEQRYGAPDAILAPNPSLLKKDHGTAYAYVRPLATVEPSAVYFGLPVETSLGYDDTAGLRKRVQEMVASGKYQRILIGWEHYFAAEVVQQLLAASGSQAKVPAWAGNDFDSIYVLHFKPDGSVLFRHDVQGLNAQADLCPAQR